MRVDVEIKCIKTVLAKARKYNERLNDDVKKATGNAARRVRAKAQGRVRVRSSRTRGSISVKDTSARLGFEKGLAKTVHARNKKGGQLGHLVERGSAGRVQRSTGRFVGSMPASPFLAPAAAAEEGAYNAELRRIAERHEVI